MKKADRQVALLEASERLKAAKAELDAVDDSSSKLIGEIEDALRDLKLGVRFSVVIGNRHDLEEMLSFDKFEGAKGQAKWRLLRETCVPTEEKDTWRSTPLLDCPREQRYEALKSHMADLVNAAVGALEEKIKSRRGAIAHGQSILTALKKVNV